MSFLNRFVRGAPKDSPLASIVRNLEYLLNSKRSFGSLLCNFGTGDYLAEHGGANALRTLMREIKETIDIYEPRFSVVAIRPLGRDDKLRVVFELSGRLNSSLFVKPCQLVLFFDLVSGLVEVGVSRGA